MNSAKPKLAQYVKSDGSAAIYLQVIINRKNRRIDLNLTWPVKNFDRANGLCKSRKAKGKDEACEDNNLIIGQAMAKANEIFTTYRLSKRNITLELFLKEYYSDFNKECFLSFYEHRMLERYKHNEISFETLKNHRNALNKLKAWKKGKLLFFELDYKFASAFDNYLKGLKLATNTRWNHHKDCKTYLNEAKRSHHKFDDPYEYFKISMVRGGWAALTFEERERLYQYYKQHTFPGTTYRRILQKFLFGCYSGLRISDQTRMREEFLENGELKFNPWKNRRYSQELVIPLLDRAKELIQDSLSENECESVFWNYTDQFANRKLKEIALEEEVKIDKNLHHHVGRETFGTLFTEAGGSVEELMWYFGHSKITTTMKYVHVTKDRLRNRIAKLNKGE